jgi:hypothetical protein
MDISSNNCSLESKNDKNENSVINTSPEKDTLNTTKIKKMIFIYNALVNGWTVKCIGKDKFEFLKPTSQLKKEINSDNCLKHFIKENLS